MIVQQQITIELIQWLKTPRGNFTNGALLALTGSLRPRHGWLKSLEQRVRNGEIIYATFDPLTVKQYVKERKPRQDAYAYAAFNRRMREPSEAP